MTPRAFKTLHDGCRARVFFGIRGYVRNQQEAEDVTSAAFATAYERRHTFRGESSFCTWVYRIALNASHKAARRKPTLSLDAWTAPVPKALIEPDLLDQVLDRADCCQKLRRALQRVPAKYRQALINRFVRGYSIRQIAKLGRIPDGTVLSRIFNGKRLLREAWEA